MTTHAIRIHETGGPEVLRWEPIEVADPGTGEARVRHTAIGLNFIDTYHRTGLYPLPLPAVLGSEAAGVVEAVGAGVSSVRAGDRVAYATAPIGSYVEARNVPAGTLVTIPPGVDDRVAAAVMLKGMTAHYLVEMIPKVDAPVVLVHAAAGGVGTLLSQWAKHRGATVIGTVGTEEKAALAKDNGCDHVVVYRHEDVVARVRSITKGAGVDVVYDSIGKDTFAASLDCLRPRGLLATFGQSSGPIGPFDPRILAQKGSLFLTRPKLGDYAQGAELATRAGALFEAIAAGVLRVRVAQTYALRDAANAHRDLEARKTTGSTVLVP